MMFRGYFFALKVTFFVAMGAKNDVETVGWFSSSMAIFSNLDILLMSFPVSIR